MPNIKISITAQERKEFGKGASRRARTQKLIPAVIYGASLDPVHILLPDHDTRIALKVSNSLYEIGVEGKKYIAVAKSVQRHPFRPIIEHIDFQAISKDEKVKIDVPIVTVGEPAPHTIVIRETQNLSIEAGLANLLQSVEISIEGFEAGSIITAGEIKLPEAVSLLTDPATPVVAIQAQGKGVEKGGEAEESSSEESSEE
jgi:large subunit ribosomal protein L25